MKNKLFSGLTALTIFLASSGCQMTPKPREPTPDFKGLYNNHVQAGVFLQNQGYTRPAPVVPTAPEVNDGVNYRDSSVPQSSEPNPNPTTRNYSNTNSDH